MNMIVTIITSLLSHKRKLTVQLFTNCLVHQEFAHGVDQYFLNSLSNAEPKDVMLRWNEKVPPCPVDGINNASETRTADRIAKVVEEYGDDLGFQGAKQNGMG